jgi:hypothetical protein
VANRLLRRVRDYAAVEGNGKITLPITRLALELAGIDGVGLDEQDREFLRTVIDVYGGGPVGIDAVAATMGEERDTLEDVIEPYLLQNAFVTRTRQGRRATKLAYEHLGLKWRPPEGEGGLLFYGAEANGAAAAPPLPPEQRPEQRPVEDERKDDRTDAADQMPAASTTASERASDDVRVTRRAASARLNPSVAGDAPCPRQPRDYRAAMGITFRARRASAGRVASGAQGVHAYDVAERASETDDNFAVVHPHK